MWNRWIYEQQSGNYFGLAAASGYNHDLLDFDIDDIVDINFHRKRRIDNRLKTKIEFQKKISAQGYLKLSGEYQYLFSSLEKERIVNLTKQKLIFTLQWNHEISPRTK